MHLDEAVRRRLVRGAEDDEEDVAVVVVDLRPLVEAATSPRATADGSRTPRAGSRDRPPRARARRARRTPRRRAARAPCRAPGGGRAASVAVDDVRRARPTSGRRSSPRSYARNRRPRPRLAVAASPLARVRAGRLAAVDFDTVVMKFGGSSVADPDKVRHVARRLVDAKQARPAGRRHRLGDGQDHGWADRPRPPGLADAERARVRHAALDRRAHRLRARRDGDPRPRPGGGLAHRLAGRHPHRRRARQGEDSRDPRRPRPGRARSGQDRPRRRLPGLLARHDGVTTLGRGGTDATAVALAAALGAACEIYSDVPGVFTADPRLVPERAQAADGLVRGDARDVRVGREGADAPLGRARPQSRRSYSCPLHVLGRGGHLGSGRRSDGAANRVGGDPQRERRRVHPSGIPDRPGWRR